MCNNFPNIRITEGNNFSLIFPLRSRTYVATKPIDEDIDPEQLKNVVVTFGGVEYPAQRTAQGVQIDLPATLAVGTYNILLTADYLESSIRAAYESAVTIVPWSAQSTAEQYITGSPIVMRAAYVLSGAMTDAGLEALKEEYREKIEEAERAKEEAEQAKQEFIEKVEQLDGVAKEKTSQQILNAVSDNDSKQTIVDAINYMGGSATTDMTWAQLAQQIEELETISPDIVLTPNAEKPINIIDAFLVVQNGGIVKKCFHSNYAGVLTPTMGINRLANLEELHMPFVTALEGEGTLPITLLYADFERCTKCRGRVLSGSSIVQKIRFPKLSTFDNLFLPYTDNLIDITTGSEFNTNYSFLYARFNNARMTDSSSLCFATDQEEYGRTFANNWEKWKWCMINHFAANLPDRSNLSPYTITFGSVVLSSFDQEMTDAFLNKGWVLN